MTAQGSQNLKIEGFSYIKGMGVGKYIASDVFFVGGHMWQILFYPDGRRKDESNDIYVSLYVTMVNYSEKDLTVWFEYYLLDQNGNKWKRSKRAAPFKKMKMNKRGKSEPDTINVGSRIIGYRDFYKRTDLEKSQFIKDDCFTIQCTVSVAKTSVDVLETLSQPLPLCDMDQCYEVLLKTREGSDISYEVEGEIFYAHKLILSTRSPVFKAQFFGPLTADNNQPCIKVEEMQAPVFKALLHFIYCAVIPDSGSDCEGTIMTQHLLAAADRYGILTLKSLCESRLCENLAIDTVASTLAFAEQHCCFLLKWSCFEFIGLPQNLEGVMQTDGFKILFESFPATIRDLLKYVARGSEEKRAKSRKPHFGCSGFRFWQIGK